MDLDVLEFEKPIVELDNKVNELRNVGNDGSVDLASEVKSLEKKRDQLLSSIFSNLTAGQTVQLARHPKRPHTVDYLKGLFTEFDELHGDRHFSDDKAIISGLARFNDEAVAILGEERGRTTKEKLMRNFAMPRPEGYRKALRVMKLAEKFSLPVFTFIDTPGAYPGIDAEERNQSEAIARNLLEMARLKTPTICTVIGEGGSGGALAIGVTDRILMLQYSIYSVISPEGCASILWRSSEKSHEAAAAMKLTAKDSLKNKLIDAVIKEPTGGAHRDYDKMMASLKKELTKQLAELNALSPDQLLETRYEKLMQLGLGL